MDGAVCAPSLPAVVGSRLLWITRFVVLSVVAWGRWFKIVVDKSVCGALSSPGFVASDPLWVKPFVVLSLPGVVGSEPLWIERFVVLSLVA